MDDSLDRVIDGFCRDLPDGYDIRMVGDESTFAVQMVGAGAESVGPIYGGPSPEGLIWGLTVTQGEFIEHVFGQAWPRCRVHGSHPMRAEIEGWACPNDTAGRHWTYGSLDQYPPPDEPPRRDGEVRWFMDNVGWGVIASSIGDLFVHHSQIQMEGIRSLTEGERVDYVVRLGGRQGRFGAVEWCRPTS